MKTCFPPTKASSFVVLLLLLLPSAAVKTATTAATTQISTQQLHLQVRPLCLVCLQSVYITFWVVTSKRKLSG